MKFLFSSLIVPMLFAGFAMGQAFEYLDADTWIHEVERAAGGWPLRLEKFDQRLVRDWIVNIWLDQEIPPNIAWDSVFLYRLQALAAYGRREDLDKLDTIAEELQKMWPTQSTVSLYRSVLLARHGDRQAGEQLLALPAIDAIEVLPYWRSETARDKLVEIGRKSTEDGEVRQEALSQLCLLGDRRGLELALTREFIEAVAKGRGDPAAAFANITRFNDLLDITDPDKAWAIIKEKGLTLLPAKKKSVKGPIDWSKYRVKAGLPPLPATPERSPLPKKIRQPKPEKPVSATAPTQNPPANNTGALIAAGAAVVGLIVVLVWFLRKK